ncbi:MAG TPA: dihydrodipicolinate synthase family protein [Candidatus Dormibacteraeota bacterium]
MREAQAFGGTVVASATPMSGDGDTLDVAAIAPLVDWLCGAGVDGILALGTTGEGILLDPSERREAIVEFTRAARSRVTLMAHCGAQTTRDTAALAAHAAAAGADAVAVIAPPYYALDADALLAHLTAAAGACAPLPFFIYEFAARSGYAVPAAVVAELRMRAANLAGLKVSDNPWERFAPYLLEGLAVFVGPEALIHRGLAAGAVGAVSGLAAALPEVVVEAVRHPSEQAARRAGELRAQIDRFPFHAAVKRLLIHRGVAIDEAVRAPLRALTAAERQEFDRLVPALLDAARVAAAGPAVPVDGG